MDAPDPPPAPDPREIARTDAEFNRINQITPFGSLIFSGPNRNTATMSLTPELQANTDLRLQSDSSLLRAALERQGLLDPNPIDLRQFGDIQRNIDTSGINFSGPQFQGLPQLNAPNLGGVGAPPALQNALATVAAPNAPQLQSQLGSTGQIQSQIDAPFGIQSNVNTRVDTSGLPQIPGDIERFRGDVEQAVFNRGRALLDPVFSDQERALEQRLANQGLPRSGEAFDRDFERFGRGRNEAFTNLANQATITGGQEASRALGDILAAQGQGFGQGVQQAGLNLAGGQFANQAAGQGFNQALAQGGFNNQAQAQEFNQALASGQFGNQAALGQFGAGLNAAQFGLGQNLAAGQFGNQAQNQGFQNQLAQAGFNNQAGLLGLGANQGIRGQLTGEELARSQAQNAASGQNLALQQQLLNNQNRARAQALAEAQGIRGNQFNELASLLGLQQVQAPGISSFFAPGQADVTNAFALNQQAQQNAFNAQNDSFMGGLGGLFSLGAAALGGPLGGALGGVLFPSQGTT